MAARRRRELEHLNVLDVTPVRIAAWEEVHDRVVVLRPRPTGRGLRGGLDRLLFLLSARRIRLDDVGSAAWRAMDGARTVAALAQHLRAEFGDAVEPAEARLGHLVRVLHRERLVGYSGWDDEAIAGWTRNGHGDLRHGRF